MWSGPADPSKADPRRIPVWSPYLRGQRTPLHDPDRRAVLDALDLTHDAAALRRAAYEASGLVVRQLIELSGAPVSRIVDPDPAWAAPIEDRYQRFLELGSRRCSAIPPPAF